MAKTPTFTLAFAPVAIDHLDGIERKHHGSIRQAIKEQLTHTPARQTKNRKPLEQPAPFRASWELRCGPKNRFRVFYEVDLEAQTVAVLAIGVKEKNQLVIGGKEYLS
jgi:hypothetical protein